MPLGQLSMNVGAISVENLRRVGRKQRRPTHTFQLKYKPWQIQPCMIAPVLPGETMKNLLLQARVVSDPVKSPLVGWWNEYYFFYVKLRDLVSRDELTEMLLANTVPSTYDTAAVVENYHAGNGYDFVQACLIRIVNEYFRDEEEVLNQPTLTPKLGNCFQAKVNLENVMQSLMLDTDAVFAEDEQLLGEGYTLPAHLSGFQTHYDAWVKMRDMTLTDATFEDWLKQHGVRVDPAEREEQHIPELLRYIREFTYPANTVDPATGAPSSALSWSIAERADKDRYFAEPGFIFGVTVSRPKVYFNKQYGSASSHLNDAYAWLPAVLNDNPFTSLKKFVGVAANGPIKDLSGDYWLDLKDLYLYGEQFLNFDPTVTAGKSMVTLPDDQATGGLPLNKTYASPADLSALFVTAATAEFINADGRVDLSILSAVGSDTTA
jgi:hypothetical protein